jgi:hypothetical protein
MDVNAARHAGPPQGRRDGGERERMPPQRLAFRVNVDLVSAERQSH